MDNDFKTLYNTLRAEQDALKAGSTNSPFAEQG